MAVFADRALGSVTTAHPVIVAKAKRAFESVSFEPSRAWGLACWAQTARELRAENMGVIVAASGSVIATTYRENGIYRVTPEDAQRLGLRRDGSAYALACVRRIMGQDAAHFTYGDLCTGAPVLAKGEVA